MPISKELQLWQNEAYTKNPHHPEQLCIKTFSGNIVRSKSEAFIDMVLFQNHIPFRYECALQLGKLTLYPDFTIRHPTTGSIYYWEHFGLMDDTSYRKKTIHKLNTYIQNEIIPSINLITTYETQEHPLSPSTVESIIDSYFRK